MEGVRNFARSIGFTINRKQKRLKESINLIDKHGNKAALQMLGKQN